MKLNHQSFVFNISEGALNIYDNIKGKVEVFHSAKGKTQHIFDMCDPYIKKDGTACANLGENYEAPEGAQRDLILAGERDPKVA